MKKLWLAVVLLAIGCNGQASGGGEVSTVESGTPIAIPTDPLSPDFSKFPIPPPLPPDTRTPEQLQQAACLRADKSWACKNVKQVQTLASGPSSATPPASWSVPAWFVNASSGNDANDCITSGTPCKTKAQIIARWGTYSPVINTTNVVITYQANDSGGNDPGFFSPFFVNGGSLRHTAPTTTTSFTGTLNVVTAKNQASNQALTSSFNTTTGAIAASQLLVNTTRANSFAFTVRNLGSNVWLLTQPMSVFVPNGSAPTEVNTWVSTDAIQGFTLVNVDLAFIGGRTASLNASFAQSHIIDHINVVDTGPDSGVGSIVLNPGSTFVLAADVFGRNVSSGGPGNNVVTSNIYNCDFQAQLNNIGTTSMVLQAGVLRGGGTAFQTLFGGDIIITGTSYQAAISTCNGGMYMDSQFFATLSNFSGGGPYYGASGGLNIKGLFTYTSTAVVAFPLGTLQLNGVATGYSNATAAGVTTIHGGITLNGTNLDAAAGTTGFGGYAYGGGGVLSKSGVQP